MVSATSWLCVVLAEGALVSLEEETDSIASASATPFKITSEEIQWDAECQTEDDGLEVNHT